MRSLLLCLVPATATPDHGQEHGYRSSAPWLERKPVITSPTALELVGDRPLPQNFDWRNVGGRSFVTFDQNQHVPQYCGGCWVFSSTSALNDRIKIMRNGRFPDVMISRQALLNCVPDPAGKGPAPGCHGGDPWMVHHFMHHTKVGDETCIGFAAENQECTPVGFCRNCFRLVDDPVDPFKPGPCWGQPTFIGYGVGDYGQVTGEEAMMKEIYARGPISCSFVTTPDFVANYTRNAGVVRNGVYVDRNDYDESQVDHIMSIAGWGETEDGTKYWVVRNSFGTYWANAGWFLLERGTNSLRSESLCDWAVPDFEELDYDLLHQVQGDYYLGIPGGTPNIPANGLALPTDLAAAYPATGSLGSVLLGAVLGAAAVLGVVHVQRPRMHQERLLG